MAEITNKKFKHILSHTFHNKAPGLLGIQAKLWRKAGLNTKFKLRTLLNAFILIPKPKEWGGNIDITRLITLIESTRKILTKILTAKISKACELHNILKGYNTSVLKNTFTVVPIHVINAKPIEAALKKIKMNNRFTEVFCLMYNNRSNRIITKFGLSDKYQVQDRLDQEKTSLPIMWRIFYDPLMCEVKQANYSQEYKLTAEWKKWDNQADTQSLIASVNHLVFIDNTVWIANSRLGMQSILDTTSSFFRMVDIEINLDKTETMVVRLSKKKLVLIRADGKNETMLKMIGSDIKAVCGVIRKKHITEKQAIYIFNTTVKKKANLLVDFLVSAMHHSLLYNLFRVDDIQAKNKIIDLLIRLNSNDIAEMATSQPADSKMPGVNLIANIIQIMKKSGISFKSSDNTSGIPESLRLQAHLIETVLASCATYTKVKGLLRKKNILYLHQMDFTRKYKQSDSDRISKWFKTLETTLTINEYRKINVVQCEALGMHKITNLIPDGMKTIQRNIIYIQIPDTLLPQWRRVCNKLRLKKEIEILTDGSLVKAGSKDVRGAAAFVTHGIEANFGIAVDRILSSTKTEAKAVLLALKAVPYKCKLTLNTDSRANAIKTVISEKEIELNINKVAAHTGIAENEMADKLAKEATAFDIVDWIYNARNISYIPFCKEVELDLNIRHFLNQQTEIQGALDWIGNNKVQEIVKSLDQGVDWKCTTKVWNWNGKMLIDDMRNEWMQCLSKAVKRKHKILDPGKKVFLSNEYIQSTPTIDLLYKRLINKQFGRINVFSNIDQRANNNILIKVSKWAVTQVQEFLF
ncbi:hypothetical protein G9A89_007960 [Geosiphon pyriformis]|nr:hypothetical protein G9A89_007960 [Geosiphon pyriformis]